MCEIQLSEIRQAHSLTCPCGQVRLVVESASVAVPGGGHWLTNGDTIFGLYQALVDAGLEKPISVSAENPVNYDYEWLVGTCPGCKEDYLVLQVSMIDEAVTLDEDFVQRYFLRNIEVSPPTNFIAKLPALNLEWLTRQYTTPKGISLTHLFGPFPLNTNSLQEGKELLLKLWPQLKALAHGIHSKTVV